MTIKTRIFGAVLFLAAINTSVSHAELLELGEVFSSGNTTSLFGSGSDTGLYVQGNTSASILDLNSGGFNTEGGFPNTGDSQDTLLGLGGAIGTFKQYDKFRVRLEAEGMWQGDSTNVTNSFPGPPGPITFFYTAQAEQNWSAMANLWFDAPLTRHLAMYAGGGIGAAGTRLTVDDTVVVGQSSSTNFAYQVGTGLILPVGKNVEFDMGYRFLDAGKTTAALDGGASGNYTADLLSHQLMFSVRLKLR